MFVCVCVFVCGQMLNFQVFAHECMHEYLCLQIHRLQATPFGILQRIALNTFVLWAFFFLILEFKPNVAWHLTKRRRWTRRRQYRLKTGAHFPTVSPGRHSQCCTRSAVLIKSDRCSKLKKIRARERSMTPGSSLTSTHLAYHCVKN